MPNQIHPESMSCITVLTLTALDRRLALCSICTWRRFYSIWSGTKKVFFFFYSRKRYHNLNTWLVIGTRNLATTPKIFISYIPRRVIVFKALLALLFVSTLSAISKVERKNTIQFPSGHRKSILLLKMSYLHSY